MGTIFFNQATGQNFASQYGAVFIKSIGTVNPQTMGIVNAVAAMVSTGAAMFATDRYGRRLIFITGAVIQTCALFSMAGLGMVSPSTQSIGEGITALSHRIQPWLRLRFLLRQPCLDSRGTPSVAPR